MKNTLNLGKMAWSLYLAGLITLAELDSIWANLDRDLARLAVKS